MILDSADRIWVFYQGQSAATCFNPETNQYKHYQYDSLKPNGFPNHFVSAAHFDSKGNFWLGFWGGGLAKFDTVTGNCKRYIFDKTRKNDPHNCPTSRIKSIIELKDGKLLIGFFETSKEDNSMPYIFDPVTETFNPYPFEEALTKCDPPLRNYSESALRIIHFINLDKRGNLWLGTYSGLFHYDTYNKVIKRISASPQEGKTLNLENTRSIAFDNNGLAWVSTTNSGMLVVDTATFKTTYAAFSPKVASSLSDDEIVAVRKDPNENIWILTGTGGFSIYSSLIEQFKLYQWEDMGLQFSNASQDVARVNQMLVVSDNKILASCSKGIIVFDHNKQQVTDSILQYFKSADPNKLDKNGNSIEDFKLLQDTLLYTSYGSPCVLYPGDRNATHLKREINAIYGMLFRHDKKMTEAYFITEFQRIGDNTIYKYNPSKTSLESFFVFPAGTTLSGRYSFVMNNGKWLLSGGPKGFHVFDPITKKYTSYGVHYPNHLFPDSTILSCTLDSKNRGWFCTSNGLFRYDFTNEKYENINQLAGIQNDETVCSAITDPDGIHWIILEKGIIRWDEKSGEHIRIDAELGLFSVKFLPSVAQLDEKGWIYCASTSGAFIFNPADIHTPKLNPELLIAGVLTTTDTLYYQSADIFLNSNPDFAYNRNSFSFDFYSNQIYAPHPHHYYYRLNSSDSIWQDNGTSSRIRLNNLSPGQYHLEVKLINAYNKESKIQHLQFEINKPFWLSWWFILLSLCFIGLLIYFYIKSRERKLLEQKKILEQKVEVRTAEVVEKAKEIHFQKDIIEEKNKQLTDSIQYAQKIQQSILPDPAEIKSDFPDHFILFRPKDIVSGDFYWHSHQEGSALFALVDCTGHGVPGGFMSMLGSGLLNQIVNEEKKLRPDIILNELRNRVIIALKQTNTESESRDGMDISLIRFIPQENKLQFAGAFNGIYKIRNGELTEIRGDKQPIGIYVGERKSFTVKETEILPGDSIYISTDGYADQFGGPKGKKFKSSNFEKLLVHVSGLAMNEQHREVEKTFLDWKGKLEQIDDISVIGIRF
jgi:serine phosphatase RsbU (regulator of sigma subunit)/ligand-binding sensor domain-containing protein